MPLQATSGAASYDAFGGGAAAVPQYIEDVFSTYLYGGNSSTQTITNGIDLSTKGGLVWVKRRDAETGHNFYDTTRGRQWRLASQITSAQTGPSSVGYDLTSFNTTGFSLGPEEYGNMNDGGNYRYVSWTFRKQPKFFDVVTFTSNGSGGGTFSHNLGSFPGCVIIKSTSAANSWLVYHQSTGTSNYLELQSTAAQQSASNWISVNSTSVTVDSGWLGANRSMVAYLFAHDAGGFGLTGTDNVISCGSTTGGSTVTLGWEPQWILWKNTSAAGAWYLTDNMRQMTANGNVAGSNYWLFPNTSGAEVTSGYGLAPTATGFIASSDWGTSGTYIYIAIRRGPMKVPTSGTSVFSPVARAGTGAIATVTAGFPVDLTIIQNRASGNGAGAWDRLRGRFLQLRPPASDAEVSYANSVTGFDNNTAITLGTDAGFGNANSSGDNYANWMFGRAPSFFDVVCYTGTGSARTINHNLAAVPEMIFIKCRSAANGGLVYNKTIGASNYLELFFTGEGNYPAQGPDAGPFNSTTPTSSVFSVGTYSNTNGSGATYVAYLFATCAGVSKVGTYTGTGTTLQVDCGFTSGARFVMIKRTSYPASGLVAGGWFVWDTARGIVAGNDPYLLLDSTAAEVTGTDYVDTYSAGFEISSTAPIQINESGKTYIFLAIA
jgi:hypothetical protein